MSQNLLTLIARFGTETPGPSAVHSGNMGDIIHALPAIRALGITRLVLNIVSDPPLGGRMLTETGARFLVPLLLTQAPLTCIEIAAVPISLSQGFGKPAETSMVRGLPLEHIAPGLLGVDYVFDRFRLQPLDRRHLVASHSDAVGATARGNDAWIILPSAPSVAKNGIILSLTPRYRNKDISVFKRMLEGFGPITKVGLPEESWVYADIPGDMLTATDALDLAQRINQAALFIGGPSLPYAIAEGLKAPRLVDSPSHMLNAWPLGARGFVLPSAIPQARALIEDLMRDADAPSCHAWVAPPVTPTLGEPIRFGLYRAYRGQGFREETSQWQVVPRAPGVLVAEISLPTDEAFGGPSKPPLAGLRLDVKTPEAALYLGSLHLIGATGVTVWSLDLEAADTRAFFETKSVPGGLLIPPLPTPDGLLLLKSDHHAWFTLPIPADVLAYHGAGGRVIIEARMVDRGAAVGTIAATLEQTRGQVRTSLTQIEQLEREVASANGLVAAMRASHSWRVTAPLRALKKLGIPTGLKKRLRATLLKLPYGHRLLKLRAQLNRARKSEPLALNLAEAKTAFRAEKQAEFEAFLASGHPLVLPRAEKPLVSIVLILWNQAELSYACLTALAAETAIPIEVVIADNASSDRTNELLAQTEGAIVQRNDSNLGFLLAVNKAVQEATGEHVLLLNNDAVMRPGALRAALETLTETDDIGAVGGRIILLNGRLQEAGSIIWQDGSCLGYGRNLPPESPEVMFRRDVDYCSGAFLLFRRALFVEMGGFDARYAPAYYEETDFCLRLWQRGLRVVYEPHAVLDHFEFGSSEKSGQALALQQKNRLLFLEKHQAFLARQWAPDLQNVLAARTRAPEGGTERVLIIDDRVPLPPLGSGFPRACHLLDVIAQTGRQVTFYPVDRPQETWEAIQQWLPPTVEVMLDQGRAGLSAFLKARRGLYDTVLISRPHNMELLRALLKDEPDLLGKARLIYDAEAVFAVREKHRARLFGSANDVARAERDIDTELKLASIAQRIVTVSSGEASHFLRRGYRDVRVIGHGITPHPTPRAFAARRNLLFVGLLQDDGSPNVDSLQWFARDVAPRLPQHLSEAVELQVVGRTGAKALDELPTGCLRLIGPVDDLIPIYDRSRVFVAPTRFAGGIPHKIHEAAAYGVPVVATSLLAEQLGWTDGVELLTADDPDAFARQIARLYQNEALWTRLRNAALARMAEDCDPQEFARRVQALVSF
jgi:GT2 family glycosyltransferase/glycosyltransferase involved in cell wall biosynthesis